MLAVLEGTQRVPPTCTIQISRTFVSNVLHDTQMWSFREKLPLFHATYLFTTTVQKTSALQFLFAATLRIRSPAVVAALFFFDRDELALVTKLYPMLPI